MNVEEGSLEQYFEELKQSNKMGRLLLDNADEAFFFYGMEGKLVYVNPAFEKITGYTTQQLYEENFIPYVHPDDQDWTMKLWQGLFKGENFEEVEYRIIKKDGEVRWCTSSWKTVFDGGRQVGIQGKQQDITERKLGEEAVRRSDVLERLAMGARLTDVLAALIASAEKHDPDSICSVLLLDDDGKRLRLGTAPRQPGFYSDAIDGIEVGPDLGSCGAAAYSAKRVIVEDSLTHSNWVDLLEQAEKSGLRACWSEPILSSTGEVLGTFAVYYLEPRAPMQSDLDFLQDSAKVAAIAIERKRAEEELRESERRFRGAFEQSASGIAHISLDGVCQLINQRFCDMLGYSKEEMFGKTFRDITYPDDLEASLGYLRQALAGEFEYYSMEKRYFCRDQSVIWVNLSVALQKGEEGESKYFVAAVEDITERKRAEMELQKSENQLRMITDNLPALIVYLDADLHYRFYNRAYQDFVGASADELIGKHVEDFLLSKIYAEVKGRLDDALSGNRVAFVLPVADRDEASHYLDVNIVPDVGESGEVNGLYILLNDITEQKQAELNLISAEKKNRAWLDNSPACIKILDLDFNLQYMSASGVQALKVDDVTSLYGKPYPFNFYPESFRSLMFDNLKRALATKTVVTQEAPVVDVEGNEVWFNSAIVPVDDETGRVDYLLVASMDTTARHQAEDTVREERDKTQRYLDTVEATMVALDHSGQITLINRKGCELLGYEEHELLGKNWFDTVLPSEVKDEVKQIFSELTAGRSEEVEYHENTIVTRDGQARVIAWHNNALRDADGSIVGVLGAGVDITEHRQTEQALRNIVEGTSPVIGQDYFYTLVRNLASALGVRYAFVGELVSGEEDAIQTVSFWSGADYGENFKYQLANTPCEKVVGKELCVYPQDVRDSFPDDHLLIDMEAESYIAMPLFDSGHRSLGVLAVLDDKPMENISLFKSTVSIFAERAAVELERKYIEEKSRNHHAELAHMARLNTMGEMVTGLAHELNQPLAAIINYAAACKNILKSGEARPGILSKTLEDVGDQAMRASEIIRHLRQFVKKQEPQKAVVRLNSLVKEVLNFTLAEIKSQHTRLVVELADELPEVHADAIQIEQVLVNLVRNSLQAMEETAKGQRQLNIRTYLNQEGLVQVEVSDAGPGMDAKMISSVFKPFVSSKGGESMGLGLSICRTIIEAHGGRLWVQSESGKGASFCFFLPQNVK